jgi:putative membrane protein
VANTAEIQVARMAAKKASSSDVKKLAEKLAVDHSKNREEVKALARKLNQPVIPAAGGDITAPDNAATPSDLEGKSGADFDRAFVEHQIRVHQSNIQKLQDQMLPAADNAQVKVYLQKALADMQRHLASLQEVQQKISS